MIVSFWSCKKMGCLCGKIPKDVEEVPKTKEYSWDKREKGNPQDYMLDNLKDEDFCRTTGSVNGQQFVVQNCKNSSIFLLDYIDSINIDDCMDCLIVLGPVKGSVFIRDCSKCVIVVPCGQFRLRDCHYLDVFLLCATQPIIEASSHIRFACIRLQYNHIRDHMKQAGLSIYNNFWYSVHDFTPSDENPNWKRLPPSTRLQDYITPPFPFELRSAGWSVTNNFSFIPLSHGMPETVGSELCLVLCLRGQNYMQDQCADSFLCGLKDEMSQCALFTSRELHLQPSDAISMQLNPDLLKREEGSDCPVVGLIFGGANCFHTCVSVRKKTGLEEQIFISTDPVSATKQAHSFLQCVLMHLG